MTVNSPQKSVTTPLLIGVIFLFAINLRPAIAAIGPLFESLVEELQQSNMTISLLTSVPLICMGIFASLAPWLTTRFGFIRTMGGVTLLIGFATAARYFYPTYNGLLLTAFLAGIGIAIMSPLISMLIKQNAHEATERAIGIYSFGIGVGALLSSGLSGVIYEKTTNLFIALSIWSAFAILAGLTWWKIGQNFHVEVTQPVKKTASPWFNYRAWLFLLFFGLQASMFFISMTWLAPLVSEKGFTLLQSGAILSTFTVGQLISNLSMATCLRLMKNRLQLTLIILAIGLSSVTLLWLGTGSALWIGSFFLGLSLGALFPLGLLYPMQATETAEDTNRWTAMMQTGGFLLSATMPALVGIIVDRTGQLTPTYGIMYGLLLALVIVCWQIERAVAIK